MIQWKASGFSVKHLDRNWNCGVQMSQDRRITLWFHGSTTNKSPLLKSITCTLPARISVWPHESCTEQKLIKSPKNRRACIKVWISWNLHGPLSLKSLKSVSSFFQCTVRPVPTYPRFHWKQVNADGTCIPEDWRLLKDSIDQYSFVAC